jgi:hypothetical protein
MGLMNAGDRGGRGAESVIRECGGIGSELA